MEGISIENQSEHSLAKIESTYCTGIVIAKRRKKEKYSRLFERDGQYHTFQPFNTKLVKRYSNLIHVITGENTRGARENPLTRHIQYSQI